MLSLMAFGNRQAADFHRWITIEMLFVEIPYATYAKCSSEQSRSTLYRSTN